MTDAPAELASPSNVELVDEPPANAPSIGTLLLCGSGRVAVDVAGLAVACGFEVHVVHCPSPLSAHGQDLPDLSFENTESVLAERFPMAARIFLVDDLEKIVEICGIGSGHFVCIDFDSVNEALTTLRMALESHAFYIGVAATRDERDEMYAILRDEGVPAAELAAVSCPMGLPLDAETPPQKAIAIMAELLAARAGTLKRLRLDN